VAHRSGIDARALARCLLGSVFAGFLAMPAASWAVDWSKASARDITLFYPGQKSWEKVLTATEHKGATKLRAGDTCASCHADEEADMGTAQAEAAAFAGRSSVVVQVKAAVEGGALYVRISGPAAGGKAPNVAFMLGNEALKSTAQAGCWGVCHDDAPGMASDSGQDLGKYLSRSRSKNTATGGGTSVRPAAELDQALAAGEFLDLIEVEASGKVERGYVLDKFNAKEAAGAGSVKLEGDHFVAEMHRPLAAGGKGELALAAGSVYHFGVAIHDPGVKKYQHLVSLGNSLAIGSGTADVVAAGK
jgi:hypothetical protein